MRLVRVCSAVLAIFLATTGAAAGQATGSLPTDSISNAAIRAATTDSAYLSPWVSTIPDHGTIPSPRDFLGYVVGTPGELTPVDRIHDYFNTLTASSPRVKTFVLGQSEEGRDMIVAAIADAELLNRLEDHKSTLRRLADPRTTTSAQADSIIEGAVPIYWMTAGLHSTELGPPEMVMELAYRLAVEDREPFETIRNNVITLITPVLEVDGRTRQVEWYRRHVQGHTDRNNMPPRSPPFWGHYTFHDNNRDGIVVSQPLTRNYLEAFFEWRPTVSLDLHESVPLLYVSGGTGPYNETIDPLTIGEWHTLANYEVARATGMGMPGVWTWGFYTGWYPGYLLWVTNNHNAMGRFYETFGNGTAETLERDLSDASYAGKKITTRQWYRSVPPPATLDWSMRNNTNYMQTGAIASLEMVAENSRLFLDNFYLKGVRAMERGSTQPPYAFHIPAEQRDRDAARQLIDILRLQGIEVSVVAKDTDLEKHEFAEGDLIVSSAQPFGPLARNLLMKQEFPADAEHSPYDDVAWTLGLLLGVETHRIDDAAVLEVSVEPLAGDGPFTQRADLPGRRDVWALPHLAQRELGPFRFALPDVPVYAAGEAFEDGGRDYPAGTLLIDADSVSEEQLRAALSTRALELTALRRMPDVEHHTLDIPRIAVFQSWRSTQNAGWVRYTLDQAGVPYTFIGKDRVRAGNLRRNFDVLLIPQFGGGTRAKSIVAGIDPKWSPLAYITTPDYPSHGVILSSEDITGGIGFAGLEAIRQFVESGGTVVALGSGTTLVTETGMIHDVSVKRPAGLNTPGSVITAKVLQTDSPLTYGYPELTHVFRGNGPLFSVAKHRRYLVPLQFGTKAIGKSAERDDDESDENEAEEAPPLVQSGGIVNGNLDGEAAMVHTTLGDGHLVLFAWNPMHRHITHHDHALVYNALLFWNDLEEPVAPESASP
jgi:hypothetical protein